MDWCLSSSLSLNKTLKDHSEEIHLIGFSAPSFRSVVVNRGCSVHCCFIFGILHHGCQNQMMRRKPQFMKHYTFNLFSPFETFFFKLATHVLQGKYMLNEFRVKQLPLLPCTRKTSTFSCIVWFWDHVSSLMFILTYRCIFVCVCACVCLWCGGRPSYRVTCILVSKSRVLMDWVTSTLPMY